MSNPYTDYFGYPLSSVALLKRMRNKNPSVYLGRKPVRRLVDTKGAAALQVIATDDTTKNATKNTTKKKDKT